ncbi:MAG: polyphosphate:AMP phosphotransferase [Bacteroidota bacterium]|nr:polyphosphate:AMP phosphotransferase [Bacteroidota bacterium]
MLEKVDLNKSIEKEEYKTLIKELENKLCQLQRQSKDLKIPLILVFEGWDAAGKGTLINQLILPLDPRGFNVYSIQPETEEEALHPFLWRFWNKIPEKGRIGIFDRSWYRRVSTDRIDKIVKSVKCNYLYEEIKDFERQLSDDGYVIIKFFLHISKKVQKERLKKLASNPTTSWKVTDLDIKHNEEYDKTLTVIDEMIEKTDTEYAPWKVIESKDKRFAIIKIIKSIVDVLESKIIEKKDINSGKLKIKNEVKLKSLDSSILDKIDLSQDISKEKYLEELKKYQELAREIEHKIYIKRIPIIILYEGWDAAGKGGNIKRLVQNLDPRGYEVVPIFAPNDIEKAHHYLWRFWNKIPKAGHIGIFDRTWYGRVLVERIEGFCSENEWKRAYKEINETEKQLVDSNSIIIKFWLHIDKDEQLKRFEERQNNPFKQWKITDEDWRNREKWDLYKDAIDEMLFRTSTTYAPWTIVESNNKYHSRLKTLKTLIDTAGKVL